MGDARILAITGASGHVGAALLRELLAHDARVRVLDLRPPPGIEPGRVDFRCADVTDAAAMREGLEGVDVLFHLAAKISIAGNGRVWQINVGGVRTTCEAALACGVRRLVHCSSVHAFDAGRCGPVLDEQSPRAVRPELPVYDRSKAEGERVLRSCVARGLDAVVVNPTGVLGPFDFGPSRGGRILRAFSERRIPALVDGAFDWVDVRDVALALVAAAEVGRTGESYLLPGHRASMRELAALVGKATGAPVPRVVLPWRVAEIASRVAVRLTPPSRRQDSLFTPEALHALRLEPRIDGSKARRELEHAPRPLVEPVEDACAWLVAHA
jgi:dihydroflavonol-4-reductase